MLEYSGTYHLKDISAAIKNADSYRDKAELTGKTEFIDIIVDAESALNQAMLTTHQKLVIALRWQCGMNLTETGNYLGCSYEAVRQSEQAVTKKVQTVLNKWGAVS